jgi:hypothetical protein
VPFIFLTGTSLLDFFESTNTGDIGIAVRDGNVWTDDPSCMLGTNPKIAATVMQYVGDPVDLKHLASCNKLLRNALTLEMAYKSVADKKKKRGEPHIETHVSQELSALQTQGSFQRYPSCPNLYDPMHVLERACHRWEQIEARGRNRILGADMYLTKYILEFVHDTKTLYNVSQVNKCLYQCINVTMVVRCGLLQGGKPMRALMQIYPALRSKTIYPPDGRRLLRICNGRRCEFCYNAPVNPDHCKGQLHQDCSFENQRRTLPRADNGTYACWTCLTKHRNPRIAKTWKYPSLTRGYQKVVYSRTKRKYYLKGAYLSNRRYLFELFNHRRSLAKPYFERWHRIVRRVGGDFDFIPTTTPWRRRSHMVTNDAVEFVWAAPTTDASGLPIGPLLNHTLINRAVAYLKRSDNDGLDHFYDRVIPNPPNAMLYEEFVNAYEGIIESAKQLQQRRRRARLTTIACRQYNRLEWTVRAIARVARHITLKRLQRACRNVPSYCNTAQPTQKSVAAIQRLLLLYREDHRLRSNGNKMMITFVTGNRQMNDALTDALKTVCERPFDLVSTIGAASEAANKVCRAVVRIGFLHSMWRYSRVFQRTSNWSVPGTTQDEQYEVQTRFATYHAYPFEDPGRVRDRWRRRREDNRRVV